MSPYSLGLADPLNPHNKKPSIIRHHRRQDSGELDVFEATQYFSGSTVDAPWSYYYYYNNNNNFPPHHKKTTSSHHHQEEEEEAWRISKTRTSLDVPMMMMRNHPTTSSDYDYHHQTVEHKSQNHKLNEEKINKQPSSPGGRLASFLNSLFNYQAALIKKKNKKKSAAAALKDNNNNNNTCSKEEGRSQYHSPIMEEEDHNHNNKKIKSGVVVLKSSSTSTASEGYYYNHHHHQKRNLKCNNGVLERDRIWVDDEDEDEDGGGESESSSDLFELENCHDLGFYSSSTALPVYQTTRPPPPPPISNAPLRRLY